MSYSATRYILRVMSGEERGVRAALLRAALRLAEAPYSTAMRLRNLLYDRRIFAAKQLPHPVISVGNITAGGTGKTPFVRYLAERLRDAGHHPAVLLRGYRSAGGSSDEEDMLRAYLSGPQHSAASAPNGGPRGASAGEGTGATPVIVYANPDRFAGGQAVLAEHPEVDVFILDDGFQHRRLARSFDIVLIDATQPFGYGHVHPRGLLREPLCGLRRANAVVLTRCEQAAPAEIDRIASVIRSYNGRVPIFHARHEHTGFRSPAARADEPPDLPVEAIAGRRFHAFAGIANPASLERQLRLLPGELAACHWFPDHHAYNDADVAGMVQEARSASADLLIVTEKDWAKLCRLQSARASDLPLWRIELAVRLDPKEEAPFLRAAEQAMP